MSYGLSTPTADGITQILSQPFGLGPSYRTSRHPVELGRMYPGDILLACPNSTLLPSKTYPYKRLRPEAYWIPANNFVSIPTFGSNCVITDQATGQTILSNPEQGPSTVLYSPVDPDFPFTQVETPSSLILLANGIDPVLKWDPLTQKTVTAGVIAPTSPLVLGATPFVNMDAQGNVIADPDYWAFYRYKDSWGNYSSFSPISNTAAGGVPFTYTGIVPPTEAKVVSIQLFRNTSGQASVYYLDGEITNFEQTAYISYLTDDDLSLNLPYAITSTSGQSFLNLHNVPPSHKSCLEFQVGRAFMAVDVEYRRGNARVTFQSTTVYGVDTQWKSNFVGRAFYVVGAPSYYVIVAVNVSNQTITLDSVYTGVTNEFGEYTIRPLPSERRLVYYCVDEATEILTDSGWKFVDDLRDNDLALGLDPETNEIDWVPILSVHVFPFDGELNRWQTNRFDALTTDDHRWLIDGCGIVGGHWTLRVGDRRHFATTSRVSGLSNTPLILGGGDPIDQVDDRIYEDEFVELAGWYITEGTQKGGKSGTIIYQSVRTNPEKVARIRELCAYFSSRGCTATECAPHDLGWGPILGFYFGKGIGDRLRASCPGKRLTPSFLRQLTSSQLVLLYETLMAGDGHRHVSDPGLPPCTDLFTQKDRETVSAFQMLCAMLGRRSRSRDSKYYDCATVTVYQHGRSSSAKIRKTRERYAGRVWCPTTATKTWFARRNGTTYWTGNSEADLPESWPPTNSIQVHEDGDELTGLVAFNSFLYIVEKRHTYRFTYQNDPSVDGFVFSSTNRGCVSQRCIVRVEDSAWMLDEQGIHKFSGGAAEPVSEPVQDLFQVGQLEGLSINWGSDTRLWHAAWDPEWELIRWFVAFGTDPEPRDAICYQYRLNRFWVENYERPITSSTQGIISTWRSLVGSTARQILCLSQGTLDGIKEDPKNTQGSIVSAEPTSFTVDTGTYLPSSLINMTVGIMAGRGVGQIRIIVKIVGAKIYIDRPWEKIPDSTSVYQFGSFKYSYQTGWFRFTDDEAANSRDVEIVYAPTKYQTYFNVGLFYNFDDAPRQPVIDRRMDNVTYSSTNPWVSVYMTGFGGRARLRQEGHGDIFISDQFAGIGLTGISSVENVRIRQITVDGCEQ